MTRRQTKVGVGGAVRYRVVIEGEPTPATGNHQLAFLKLLATQGVDSGFLLCGMQPFSTLSISHNGNAWQAVAEAETTETQS
jgi:hypothetical protein